VPPSRGWIRRLLPPLAGAYALGGLLAAPLLYYALSDFHHGSIYPPKGYVADLLNFVVPTETQAVSRGWTGWTSFGANAGENGAFIGLPLLAIVVLFALERRRTPGGRFLLAALGLAVFLSLGPRLRVDGHNVMPLPWRLVTGLPLFDKFLPTRFTVYVSLLLAVVTAIWAATTRRGPLVRVGLPVLAVLALVPNSSAHSWATTYDVPPLFWHPDFRSCLKPGEIVLPLPIADRGQADLWQVRNGFHFRLAGGRLLGFAPPAFDHPEAVKELASGLDYPQRERNIRRFVQLEHVGVVVLDTRYDYKWQAALDAIEPGTFIGGARVYPMGGALGCG
jgi:hypothetical protein